MSQRVRSPIILMALTCAQLFLVSARALPQEAPVLAVRDRIRLAEAFRLADELGDQIWKGWHRAFFAVLLVTPEHEYLVRHPKPSADFTFLRCDSLLQSDIYVRKRVFQVNLLASFPAVSGVSTIVIGQAENTSAKTSTRWVLTVLHEHFHQLQASQPGYYADAESLKLSRGDQTGMWMLNYPFPYDSSAVVRQFSLLCRKLFDALQSKDSSSFNAEVSAYRQARKAFQRALAEDDYRYFSFQVWQEGVARYTEYEIAKVAATSFHPSESFSSLPDFTSFRAEADTLFVGMSKSLPSLSLSTLRRVAFYPFGAAEALLLDVINPAWREVYFRERFDLERCYQP